MCGAPAAGAKTMHIDHDHACCPGRRSAPARRLRAQSGATLGG
ncbi:hypothetical protein ACRAWF_03165 [Streptomyces sp. L7]